jgi:hypothetical protein
MTRWSLVRRAAGLAAGLLLAGAVFAAPPPRLTLVYDLARNGEPFAELSETLQQEGGTYSIVSEAKGKGALAVLPLGLFRRESRGAVRPEGLRPDYFRDQRGARIAVASFDWESKRLTTEFRGRVEEWPLDGPVHDRLTLAYTFAFIGLPTSEVQAVVTDGAGLSAYRYAVGQPETLATTAGRFDTLRLDKIRDPGDERETAIWLARDRYFLPVRILIIERDGTRLDQTLVRLSN